METAKIWGEKSKYRQKVFMQEENVIKCDENRFCELIMMYMKHLSVNVNRVYGLLLQLIISYKQCTVCRILCLTTNHLRFDWSYFIPPPALSPLPYILITVDGNALKFASNFWKCSLHLDGKATSGWIYCQWIKSRSQREKKGTDFCLCFYFKAPFPWYHIWDREEANQPLWLVY